MTSIRCGKCKAQHTSVAQVKACYAGTFAGLPIVGEFKGLPVVGSVEFNADWAAMKNAAAALENEAEAKAEAAKWDAQLAVMVEDRPKPAAVTEGMYMNPATQQIFKVQRAVHGSGHLYAKLLGAPNEFGGKATFTYAPGVIKQIRSEWRMTLDQAKAFGALYGTCCCCGRTLTDEKSIELGIGPVCIEKYGF